jgi:hypothetical protein
MEGEHAELHALHQGDFFGRVQVILSSGTTEASLSRWYRKWSVNFNAPVTPNRSTSTRLSPCARVSLARFSISRTNSASEAGPVTFTEVNQEAGGC